MWRPTAFAVALASALCAGASCGFFASLDDYAGAGGASSAIGSGGSAVSSGAGASSGTGGSLCGVGTACSIAPAVCQNCDVASNDCETDTSSDVKNCGTCGHDCQGGVCNGGACQPVALASGLDVPSGLAVDANRVYWADQSSGPQSGKILSAPITAGTTVELAKMLDGPLGVAIDASTVFFTYFISGGGVERVDKTGMALQSLTTSNGPWGIAVDSASGGNVYWTSQDGGVHSIPKTGGTVATVASGQTVPRGVAVDAAHVYWTEACAMNPCTTGQVHQADLSGLNPIVIATGQAYPLAITIDSTFIYWVNTGTTGDKDTCTTADGSVMRAPIGGGGTVTTLKADLACPRNLAVDATGVYWTDFGTNQAGGAYNGDGDLSRVDVDNKFAILRPSLARPWGIAVDARSVYWTEQGSLNMDGVVMKLAK